MRGLFWAITTEVFSPVDEAHHFSYVAHVADSGRLPVVGRDLVSVELLEIEKRSPTLGPRVMHRRADLSDASWGAELHQYEGVQPPLYYVFMAPVYMAAEPLQPGGTVLVLRVVSVILSLLAVPLTWLLARRVFPDMPAAWLAAPALLVLIQGFNSNLAMVTNDSLVPAAGTGLVLAAVGLHQGPSRRTASLFGLAAGLAILTKLVLVGVVLIAALLFIPLLSPRRYGFMKTVGSGLLSGAVALAVAGPWFAWNFAVYGSPTASEPFIEIIGPILSRSESTIETLRAHAGAANHTFWGREVRPYLDGDYPTVLAAAYALSLVAGLAGAVLRKRKREAGWLMWLWASLPLNFVIVDSLFLYLFDGLGQAVGRYMYGVVAPVCIALAAALCLALGSRLGTVALAVLAAVTLTKQIPESRSYVEAAYLNGIIDGNKVPAVDQTLNQAVIPPSDIRVEPPCSVETIGLAPVGKPPSALQVRLPDEVVRVPLTDTKSFGMLLQTEPPSLALYDLPRPVPGDFVIQESTAFYGSTVDQTGAVVFIGRRGDPVVRLYCSSQMSRTIRFRQLYEPLHPVPMTLAFSLAWPKYWAWAGWAAVLAAAAVAIRPRRRRESQS